MTTFPPADTKAAWYQDDYPGAPIKPNVGVIHTTEGLTRPTYDGGAVAPNYTAVPDLKGRRLRWFAHFPDDRSSRALQNDPGGVETNTLNALQVELVGTCDPGTAAKWRKAGKAFIYWPEAPDWALEELAEFVAWCHRVHGIPVKSGLEWVAYPTSYGAGGQRMTGPTWRKFMGWCGHQHVPENDHGDPGALPWVKVERAALILLAHGEHDDHPDGPAPKVIDASLVRGAFLDVLDQDREPTHKRARVHVARLQQALRAEFPDAHVQVTGMVDAATLKAWTQHEQMADGSGRPTVPDVKALQALASPRFTVRK